jgi:uncharacterized membrane protein HdeD (DUF308 family)
MHEKRRNRGIGGIFIPAFLFIGLGIGLLFNLAAVGALVGLGVGFIAMAVARSRDIQVTNKPSSVSVLITILLGVLFILAGIGTVYFPVLIWPYLGAAVLILLGIWFIFRGYRAFTPGPEEKGSDDEKD